MKRIGVLTSGGDAPGMNACIRAVVRAGIARGVETVGIRRGYIGLLELNAETLTSRSVGGIARWGGTIIETARCPQFETPEGIRKGVENFRRLGLDAVIVIGGDGSLRGALELHKAGVPCAGVPGSIDNDVCETETSIGVDTAMNTILEAIDKLKDTASAHRRAFVVEVMGRRSGYLALAAGVAGGAEMVIAPERPQSMEDIVLEMERARQRGKPHFIIVVAEGAVPSASAICSTLIAEHPGFDARLTVLGHVQRGGSPTASDRLLATKLGAGAVEALLRGERGVMVGVREGQAVSVPLDKVLCTDRPADGELLRLEDMIAL